MGQATYSSENSPFGRISQLESKTPKAWAARCVWQGFTNLTHREVTRKLSRRVSFCLVLFIVLFFVLSLSPSCALLWWSLSRFVCLHWWWTLFNICNNLSRSSLLGMWGIRLFYTVLYTILYTQSLVWILGKFHKLNKTYT